jgi:hypothetical protein
MLLVRETNKENSYQLLIWVLLGEFWVPWYFEWTSELWRRSSTVGKHYTCSSWFLDTCIYVKWEAERDRFVFVPLGLVAFRCSSVPFVTKIIQKISKNPLILQWGNGCSYQIVNVNSTTTMGNRWIALPRRKTEDKRNNSRNTQQSISNCLVTSKAVHHVKFDDINEIYDQFHHHHMVV